MTHGNYHSSLYPTPEVVGDESRAGVRSVLIRLIAWIALTRYTAGAMVFVTDIDGWVAMVRPRRYSDQWTFPGGFIRRMEHPSKTAMREVAEEIGLSLSEKPAFVTMYRQGWARHFDHLYRAGVSESQPKLKTRKRLLLTWLEIAEVRWMDPSASDFRAKLGHDALMAYDAIYSKHPGHGRNQ